MIVIFTGSGEIARNLQEASAAADAERPMIARTPETLFKMVRVWTPTAVLLGVRAGGNQARAVDWIPFLRLLSPTTEIVACTYSPTTAEVDELNRLDAFTFLDLDEDGWEGRLRRVLRRLRHRQAPPAGSESGGA